MPSHLENVIRAVGNSLKAEVTPNVAVSTHTEFTEYAKVPALTLYYPSMSPYIPNEVNEKRITFNPDDTTTIKPPVLFKNLNFQVEIIGDSITGPDGIAQLQVLMLQWLDVHTTITVDGNEYEVHGELDDQPRFNPNTNIKKIMGTFTIEGVEIDTAASRTETGHKLKEVINEVLEK